MTNNSNFVQIPCICGSKNYDFIYQARYNRQVTDYSFSLGQCQTCKTVRVFPVPDISLYTEGYTASTDAMKVYVPREKPWCRDLAQEIKTLIEKNPELKNKPIVDVGCNGGELVEELRKINIEAEGCDVDPIAVDFGKRKNLQLFLRDLSSNTLEKKYGIIMMNHTLEHIIPAREMLKNIIDSLLPSGILQIHVPNYDSWISKIMNKKWGFLAPHEHVWQFTPETLQMAVEQSAPEQIKLINIVCKTNLETAEGKGLKILIKKLILFLAAKFNHGDEIIATFKKS